jgi:hypothetical protein
VTARGPLGLARVCGPRLHATLDIVVALAVAAAPIVPALRPDITGIVAVEVAALAWVRLSTLTRYTRMPSSTGPDVSGAGVAPHAGIGAGPVAESVAQSVPQEPTLGAMALRTLGMKAGRSSRRLPEAEEKLRSGARQAGRHAARLRRTWRKPPG